MARILKGPDGKPMSDEDILLALRVYATNKYGGPSKYDFLAAGDTIAQVESGNNPLAVQIGGGPGRGKYQYEEPSAVTAGNRLKNIADIVGYENPSWNTPKGVADVSKLTETQQDILFLADKLAAGNVSLEDLATGETPLEDFWIQSHGRFPESDIPARRAHWSEVIGAMKDAQARADAEAEHIEETGDYKKGGKFTVLKKNKMRVLRSGGRLRKILEYFGGGQIPYEDYGQDDSASMSYQSSMDDFSADNSGAMDLPPQDYAQEAQPVYTQQQRYTKKGKRKKRRDLRKQNRIAAREERKSLKAMGLKGAEKRAAKKQIRDAKQAGRKDIRHWKQGKIDEIGMDQQMY